MKILAVFLLIVLVVIGVILTSYNKLVSLKARFENALAQIEVQLKRRYDLIPNLVEVAKKYMQHESETFLQVTNARNTALSALQALEANPSAENISQLNNAERKLSGLLGGLTVQMEAYPELKASQNMLQLNEELTSSENRISFARQAYNDAVTGYNIQRKTIPTVFVAALLGHREDAALLEFEDADKIKEPSKITF